MTQPELYIYSLHAVAVVALFTMVGYFFGCLFHDRQYVDRIYVGSRHWMAAAMFCLGTLMFLQNYYLLRVHDSLAAASMSIIFYFTCSQFASMALVVLIRPDFQTRGNISLGAVKSLLVAAILGSSYHFCSRAVFMWCTIACAIGFFADTLIKLATFRRLYRSLLQELSDFYSENYDSYLLWMPRCTLYLSITGLVAPLSLFAPLPVVSCFNLILSFVLFYVFICYERYIVYERYCTAALQLTAEVEEEDKRQNGENQAAEEVCNDTETEDEVCPGCDKLIREALALWIEQKQFCQADLNIIDLSRQLGTNRTYLSRYINRTYQISFRAWIASMRVVEAKRILNESDVLEEHALEELAERLGFLSAQSFNRSFLQQEGITPLAYWKQTHH